MAYKRNIFTVDAIIVDSNGTYNSLTGYPKKFDSVSYNHDIDKALKRAEGDASEVWGAFCKRDDRQVQTVRMTDIYGRELYKKSMGTLADIEPQPEPQPEPEPEGEGT